MAGCYETDSPLIENGQKIPLIGEFVCKDHFSGKNKKSSLVMEKSGVWPFDSYKYVDENGSINEFKKLNDGFYLGQVKNKAGRYDYYYYDLVGKNQVMLLIPDAVSKEPYIKNLMKEYKITYKSSNNGRMRLDGKRENLLKFLAGHDKSLLAAALSCGKK